MSISPNLNHALGRSKLEEWHKEIMELYDKGAKIANTAFPDRAQANKHPDYAHYYGASLTYGVQDRFAEAITQARLLESDTVVLRLEDAEAFQQLFNEMGAAIRIQQEIDRHRAEKQALYAPPAPPVIPAEAVKKDPAWWSFLDKHRKTKLK